MQLSQEQFNALIGVVILLGGSWMRIHRLLGS